jgi:opacity protein-like surface antigen
VRASAIYAEGGVRAFAAPRSSVSPYVEATTGFAHLNVAVGGINATTSDLLNLGLGFVNRTSPVAGVGGGVMFRTGPMSFDVGYRYKKILSKDLVASLLGAGQNLQSQQIAFGVGVRF